MRPKIQLSGTTTILCALPTPPPPLGLAWPLYYCCLYDCALCSCLLPHRDSPSQSIRKNEYTFAFSVWAQHRVCKCRHISNEVGWTRFFGSAECLTWEAKKPSRAITGHFDLGLGLQGREKIDQVGVLKSHKPPKRFCRFWGALIPFKALYMVRTHK